jgi:hypothetical protein
MLPTEQEPPERRLQAGYQPAPLSAGYSRR